MRRCESCHDAVPTHQDWLPYTERHMQEVACETCHVPALHAPAIQSTDWTVIKQDGSPVSACRGIDGDSTVTDLVTGFTPVLMQRTNVDGQSMLAPYNLISSWFWIYDDADGNTRPVRQIDLQAAYLQDGAYRPEIIAAFDSSGDGVLADDELTIDSDASKLAVTKQLAALGLGNPRIYGQVQPYSINHNVVRGDEAISDCQTCHTDKSSLIAPIVLAGSVPGGVLPQFVSNINVAASGALDIEHRRADLPARPAGRRRLRLRPQPRKLARLAGRADLPWHAAGDRCPRHHALRVGPPPAAAACRDRAGLHVRQVRALLALAANADDPAAAADRNGDPPPGHVRHVLVPRHGDAAQPAGAGAGCQRCAVVCSGT